MRTYSWHSTGGSLNDQYDVTVKVSSLATVSGAPSSVTVTTPVVTLQTSGTLSEVYVWYSSGGPAVKLSQDPNGNVVQWRASNTPFGRDDASPAWQYGTTTGQYRYWQIKVVVTGWTTLLERVELEFSYEGEVEPEEPIEFNPYGFYTKHRPLWYPRWSKVYTSGTVWNRVDGALQRAIYRDLPGEAYSPNSRYENQPVVWSQKIRPPEEGTQLYAAGYHLQQVKSLYELVHAYEPCYYLSGDTCYIRNIDRVYVVLAGPSEWDTLPGLDDLVEGEPVYVKVDGRWYTVPDIYVDRANSRVRPPTDQVRMYGYTTNASRLAVASSGYLHIGVTRYSLALDKSFGYIWELADRSGLSMRVGLSPRATEERASLKWYTNRIEWMIAASLGVVTATGWSGDTNISSSGELTTNVDRYTIADVEGYRQPDGTYRIGYTPTVATIEADTGDIPCTVSGNTLIPLERVDSETVRVRAFIYQYTHSAGSLTPTTNLSKGDYVVWLSSFVPQIATAGGTVPQLWDNRNFYTTPVPMDITI